MIELIKLAHNDNSRAKPLGKVIQLQMSQS